VSGTWRGPCTADGTCHHGGRAQGWIPSTSVLQVDNGTSSATFWLAASDRNNTPLAPPPQLPPNTYLTARLPIKPRDAYMSDAYVAFLYLGYRSAHAQGVRGVLLNEVPTDSTPTTAGGSYLVCPTDQTCTQQHPVYMGDAYLYDQRDHALLVEIGDKVRVLPGPANTTDQDSAIGVSMTILGPDGLPRFKDAWAPGCDAQGCWEVPATRTVTCGDSLPVALSAVNQTAVFQVDGALTSNVTFTTCPPAGSLAPTLMAQTGISVFYGPFPVSHAWYHGAVGSSGHAYSAAQYMPDGSSRGCGNLTVSVTAGVNTWVVVGSLPRGSPATATLTATCASRIPPSFMPSIALGTVCSGWGVFSFANRTFSGAPVYADGSGKYVFWDPGCWGRWVLGSSVQACAGAFCTFGGTSGGDITKLPVGVCPGGSVRNSAGQCTPCPAGLIAPEGATGTASCICPADWTVDPATGRCAGASIGGPPSTRSLASVNVRQARATIPTAASGCSVNWFAASQGACAQCPAGCVSPGGFGNSCNCSAVWYATIVLAGTSGGNGVWTRTDVMRDGRPVYRLSTGTRYLQPGGVHWAVVANVGDAGAYAYLQAPYSWSAPTHLGTSYALCAGAGDATIDYAGRRICYCPAGMTPDAAGRCSPCPTGTFQPALTASDTCQACPPTATTKGPGSSVCDRPYCTGFNMVLFSPCTANYAGCSESVLNGGMYALVDANGPSGMPVYRRNDGARYVYHSPAHGKWVIDDNTNTSSVLFTLTTSASFAVPLPPFLVWQSTARWWVTPKSNATCLTCGAGSYGVPTADGSGCTACGAGQDTAVVGNLTVTTAGSCACAAGFAGSPCTRCPVDQFKAALGGGSCSPCPAGQTSAASGGVSCACRPGFAWNAAAGACEDVNECTGPAPPCAGTCTNTVGSFTCSCPAGMALALDGRGCRGCGGAHVGNGTACMACSPFTRPNSAGTSCVCPAAFSTGGDGACLPPARLTLTSANISGVLTLARVQYVLTPSPEAAGIRGPAAAVASPVYRRTAPAASDAVGTNMWLYWSHAGAWGRGAAAGSRWALDVNPALVGLPAPPADGPFPTYGYVASNTSAPPLGGASSDWFLYSRLPLRHFAAPAGGVSLMADTAAAPAAPLLLTPLSGVAGGATAVTMAGLVGSNDSLTFVAAGSGCSGAAGMGVGRFVLSAALQATVMVPSASGSWQLCVIDSTAAASGWAVLNVADGSIVVVTVAPPPSASPSVAASPSGGMSATTTPSASLSAGASPPPTPSSTPSSSGPATPSTSGSVGASVSRTGTGSASAMPSASPSSSGPATPSSSGSVGASVSQTGTGSASATPSASPSGSGPATPSSSGSSGASASRTASGTPSHSRTPSGTRTGTPSTSSSRSATPSTTASPSGSVTAGASPSTTATASRTPSPSVSPIWVSLTVPVAITFRGLTADLARNDTVQLVLRRSVAASLPGRRSGRSVSVRIRRITDRRGNVLWSDGLARLLQGTSTSTSTGSGSDGVVVSFEVDMPDQTEAVSVRDAINVAPSSFGTSVRDAAVTAPELPVETQTVFANAVTAEVQEVALVAIAQPDGGGTAAPAPVTGLAVGVALGCVAALGIMAAAYWYTHSNRRSVSPPSADESRDDEDVDKPEGNSANPSDGAGAVEAPPAPPTHEAAVAADAGKADVSDAPPAATTTAQQQAVVEVAWSGDSGSAPAPAPSAPVPADAAPPAVAPVLSAYPIPAGPDDNAPVGTQV